MDSDPMPTGALWRRSELMIIQVAQPTAELHSLRASFRRFHRRNYACSCWVLHRGSYKRLAPPRKEGHSCWMWCMSPSCRLLL